MSDDPRGATADVLEVSDHLNGETADLWLIEHGRRTGHVDLRPMIEETVTIDWSAFGSEMSDQPYEIFADPDLT